VNLYTSEERLILSVRPGITDFASMKFSNEGELLKNASDPDKVYLELIHPVKTELALEYVKTRSFLLDSRLILQTIFHIYKK
jgi:lipopolysaccharide/colanic/teichoic acid biosynthesis glycosyltransferase